MPQTITTFNAVPEPLLALYRHVHAAGFGVAGAPTAVLHVGSDFTSVAAGAQAQEPSLVLTLALGHARLAQEFFRGAEPAALELEAAIASVEDEIQAAYPHWRAAVAPDGPQGAAPTLWCADAELHALARHAGVSAPETAAEPGAAPLLLEREAVEQLYADLACVAEGPAAVGAGVRPTDPALAARLVVLRALMQHWSLSTVALLPAHP